MILKISFSLSVIQHRVLSSQFFKESFGMECMIRGKTAFTFVRNKGFSTFSTISSSFFRFHREKAQRLALIRGKTRIPSSTSNSSKSSTNNHATRGASGSRSKSGSGSEQQEGTSIFSGVLTTYVTLLGANYLSNCWIHPTSKLDYGYMNHLYSDDREVSPTTSFWGSRLPHLFFIPASLIFYDKVMGMIFTRYLGMISFAATPSVALVHLYCYTWMAVGSWICLDATMNPALEGKREETIRGAVKPLTIAMSLQWHADLMLATIGTTAGGMVGILRNAFAVSMIFLPVKSLGFGDVGEAGLTPHERKMNGLQC